MHRHIIAAGFDIDNLPERHSHRPLRRVQREHAGAVQKAGDRPIQNGGEFCGVDGFHQVMERRNVVPLGDIIGIARNENDLCVLALFPHPAGKLHAVDAGHFNVQQENIRHFIFQRKEQSLSRGKPPNLQRIRALLRPAFHKAEKILGIFRTVIT